MLLHTGKLTELSPSPLLLQSTLSQWKPLLDENKIFFLVHRVMKVSDELKTTVGEDNVKYAKPYYGLILWHGPSVAVMAKAMSSHHWKDFSNLVREAMDKNGAPVQPGYFHGTQLNDIHDTALLDNMKLIDRNG